MKKAKGSEFELSAEALLKLIFTEAGFQVLEVRRQYSGTQNGFDIRVQFLDDDEKERNLFFECKDYTSKLDKAQIITKVLELEAANYAVDGFIALSPKVNVSNIDDNAFQKFKAKYPFPIKIWSPDTNIAELFSVDAGIYQKIYGVASVCAKTRESVIIQFKLLIERILKEKDVIHIVNRIEIGETTKAPNEDSNFVTNLDKKLNALYDEDDEERVKFHKLRCDYKVYLEDLEDINNVLRLKIIRWQDNLRLKAERLTRKFTDSSDYTPRKFFNDFFDSAEIELLTFINNEKLDGDKEKLLHGVVFELAAECPLDWRKKNDE